MESQLLAAICSHFPNFRTKKAKILFSQYQLKQTSEKTLISDYGFVLTGKITGKLAIIAPFLGVGINIREWPRQWVHLKCWHFLPGGVWMRCEQTSKWEGRLRMLLLEKGPVVQMFFIMMFKCKIFLTFLSSCSVLFRDSSMLTSD